SHFGHEGNSASSGYTIIAAGYVPRGTLSSTPEDEFRQLAALLAASVQKCSTWNIALPSLPRQLPTTPHPAYLHLISTFRRPIRVLHSFSNENFPSAVLRHCPPPTPRSKLLESASPAQPWDASSQSPTRRAESARPRPPSTWRRRSPPSAPARCWSIAIPSPTPPAASASCATPTATAPTRSSWARSRPSRRRSPPSSTTCA